MHSPGFLPKPVQDPVPFWAAVRWPNRKPLARAARLPGCFPIFADTGQRLLQPLPMLGRLSGATSTIRIGTGILLAGLLNPYEVAEGIATIDVLSGGRALLGVGAGHRPEELNAFDCPKAERGRRLEQCLTDVRTLWSMPTYGDVKPTVIDPISLAPQQADVPIWVAGTSDAGVRRAARVGSLW